MRFTKAAAMLVAILVAHGCSGDKPGEVTSAESGDASWAPAKLSSVKGVPATAIEAAMRKRLAAAPPAKIDDDQWGHAKRLYKLYGDNALWLSDDGFHEERTFALGNAVLQAEQDGMRMDAYPIGALAQAIATVQQTARPTAEQLADADVVLTSAYAALGEDYLTGQIDPKSVAQSWFIDPQEENVDSALARGLRNAALDKSIASMRPQDPEYAALRRELDRFQRIVSKGGWPAVPAVKSLKPGDPASPAVLTALRDRLTIEGIVPPQQTAASQSNVRPASQSNQPSASGIYDRGLAAAVAVFQQRHAIVVDSSLGGETLEALNLSAAYRTAQIAANLERLRWLPRSFGSRYVHVNVPAFRLVAYDGGKPALEMKVIVGQEYEGRITPVFSDSMEFVVFRPYWNVTPDIAEKELFPKIASNPGYMTANNYEFWSENGKRRIRQKPGEKNSLGLVKFMFPNDFNIYLHDTPQDELFEKDVRAFSHGCIRLEKPAELAQWVLGWDGAKVQQQMTDGPNDRRVTLPKKLPVYITYGTAYIRDGGLWFGNDLYDRDDKLVQAVVKGALPSPETVQAVQALRRIASRE
ncbi:MAG TPA: L,D-transpeptidase family protein [Gemmatimonadaceae bacterium]|nr:L,D-transpeptidase family protein [Gemmatimonadaceae bacterium]